LGYVLTHALSLGVLIAVLYAGGLLVEARLLPGLVLPSYLHLTRFALGCLGWIGAAFLLASLGLLRPVVLYAVAVAVVAAAIARARRPSRLSGLAMTSQLPWWPATVIPAVVITLVFVSLFLEGLRPTPAWDASTYHLTIPRLYLEHGGFRPIVFNVYSNWPLNTELLFALGMAFHDYLLATLVQWLFAAVTAAALFRICQLHGRPDAGLTAACLFLANDVVLFEAGVAYVDLALAFFFVMALACLLEGDRDAARRRPAILLAGVCCGLMAGVKLIGVFGAICVGLLHFWSTWRRLGLRCSAIETLRWIVVPCMALALPWYAKAAWYTGNPLYPFFYDALRGTEWNRRLGEQLQVWQRSIGMGRGLSDYLLLPVRVMTLGGPGFHRFDGSVSHIWLVLLPVVLVGVWRDAVVRRLGAASLLYFICWALSSQQARFLLPVLAILSVAAAMTLDGVFDIGRLVSLRKPLVFLATAGASVHLYMSAGQTFADARGWLDRYRDDIEATLKAAVPPIFEYVNRELPADARLLLLNVNTAFFCRREYIADSFFEASQVNAFLLRNRRADEIQATLLGRGITHVVVGPARWGIPYPPTMDEFFSERTHLVYTSPRGDLLHEILPP
jgi:hypothetical protein